MKIFCCRHSNYRCVDREHAALLQLLNFTAPATSRVIRVQPDLNRCVMTLLQILTLVPLLLQLSILSLQLPQLLLAQKTTQPHGGVSFKHPATDLARICQHVAHRCMEN